MYALFLVFSFPIGFLNLSAASPICFLNLSNIPPPVDDLLKKLKKLSKKVLQSAVSLNETNCLLDSVI